ncbi:MAG: class I SAM-dependent methyltransferase [Terriglobales bacterium]|jgi:SAM-dependent methyltransferase
MSSPDHVLKLDIPADEAVYYEATAGQQCAELAQFDSISQLLARNQSATASLVARLALTGEKDRGTFPHPRDLWMCATYDCLAERDALEYLAPLPGKRVLQIGGQGHHAVQFMLGGASEAWLVTPVEAEARYALELARLAGVEIGCKLGLAEDLPFAAGFFDAIYSGGCAHHFQTEEAFPEIARVLVPGGRFAAEEPWRAPFYGWGIRVFGKREVEVHCRPLDARRLAPLGKSFSKFSVVQHGVFTRYPMIALHKIGIRTPYRLAWKLTQFDDALASLLGLRRFGSSVAVLAQTGHPGQAAALLSPER